MIKTYLKRAGCLLGLLLGFVFIYKGLDYSMVDDTKSLSRISVKDFYDQDHIDILFAGPSHSVHFINAVKLSEDLGCDVFNMATTGQNFKQGSYLLEDAIKKKGVKKVYYELSLSRLSTKVAAEQSCYLISDYMPLSLTKAKMLLSIFESDKYVNAFSRLRREIDPLDLPTASELVQIYNGKQKGVYKNYLSKASYLGRGQFTAGGALNDLSGWAYNKNSGSFSEFCLEDIQQEAWDSVRELIGVCKKHNVELTFYIPPYSEAFIRALDDYQVITDAVLKLCEEEGVPVLDMNLAKPEYLPIHMSDFYNLDHLKARASGYVADFFETYIEDPSGDYFYSDYDESYPKDSGRFIGVAYERSYLKGDEVIANPESSKKTPDIQKLVISAESYDDRKADIKVFEADRKNSSTEQMKANATEEDEYLYEDETNDLYKRITLDDYIIGKEIKGRKVDDRTVEITVPYNEIAQGYLVQLIDPDTKEVVMEAITKFAME